MGSGGWPSSGQVHDVLSENRPSLACTTVLTILLRLWQKQRPARQRDGRAYLYRRRLDREEYPAMRMSELLLGVHDRPAVLTHFLETLRATDRDQPRRLPRSGR